MPSPQKYERVSTINEDDTTDAKDKARNFENCPSQNVEWPEYQSSFFSRWFFLWVGPMLRLGEHAHLEHVRPTICSLVDLNCHYSTGLFLRMICGSSIHARERMRVMHTSCNITQQNRKGPRKMELRSNYGVQWSGLCEVRCCRRRCLDA
jgi:hypothetical protein